MASPLLSLPFTILRKGPTLHPGAGAGLTLFTFSFYLQGHQQVLLAPLSRHILKDMSSHFSHPSPNHSHHSPWQPKPPPYGAAPRLALDSLFSKQHLKWSARNTNEIMPFPFSKPCLLSHRTDQSKLLIEAHKALHTLAPTYLSYHLLARSYDFSHTTFLLSLHPS